MKLVTKIPPVRESLKRLCTSRIEMQSTCTRLEARNTALHRLWKLYGKENIQRPFQVKFKGDEWEVYGTRQNASSKTVHVFVDRNDKKCSIKAIKHKLRTYYLGGPPASESSSVVSADTKKALRLFMQRGMTEHGIRFNKRNPPKNGVEVSPTASYSGKLIIKNNCLLIGRKDHYLNPIWPHNFSLDRINTKLVVARKAKIVSYINENIEVGGAQVAINKDIIDKYKIPEECRYDIWFVGDMGFN